jgi:SAM-dependent methyltransferase
VAARLMVGIPLGRKDVLMSHRDGDVSERWSRWRAETDLEEYYSRWHRLEVSGQSTHGEADFIQSFGPRSVLDAGCGMGRVAIELAGRGIEVIGVDLDADLLAFARRSAPSIPWVHADLATLRLDRTFDVVAMPGNVMVFCKPEDRGRIICKMSAHLAPGGVLVAGFQLEGGPEALTLDRYDQLCEVAGLNLSQRCSTWEGDAYCGGTYVVSVHIAPDIRQESHLS